MRDQLAAAPADGLPLAAAPKPAAPVAAESRNAQLRRLCLDMLDLGRKAPPGPWSVGHRSVMGTRIENSQGLALAHVGGSLVATEPATIEALAALITRSRNALPVLAAELLRRLAAEEGSDGH